MGNLVLDREDWRKLTSVFENSFQKAALQTLIAQELPRVDREVDWSGGWAFVVYRVLNICNQHGVLDQLLVSVAQERPDRPDLRTLVLFYSKRPGWAATFESDGLDVRRALEALTSSGDPFVDTSILAHWLIRIERQVCQVRCGNEYGTGFLVAPDLVMTCYHVVKSHLKGSTSAANVNVRFDYRRTVPGAEPTDLGSWLNIDPAWPIPNLPYGEADITLQGEPSEQELDFALLKLNEPAGRQRPSAEAPERGWVDLSSAPAIPADQSPILIVQHPMRDQAPPPQMPLQIAFATPGFGTLNETKTRIAYTPSTRKGSSGSPVFDGSLNVVALHHNRGQINPEITNLVINNRGIPLGKIRAALSDAVRELLIPAPAA